MYVSMSYYSLYHYLYVQSRQFVIPLRALFPGRGHRQICGFYIHRTEYHEKLHDIYRMFDF